MGTSELMLGVGSSCKIQTMGEIVQSKARSQIGQYLPFEEYGKYEVCPTVELNILEINEGRMYSTVDLPVS